MDKNTPQAVPDDAVKTALENYLKGIQKFAVDSINTVIPTIQQAMAERGAADKGDRKWEDNLSKSIQKIKEFNALKRQSNKIPLTKNDKFQAHAEIYNNMAKSVGDVGGAMKQAGSMMDAFGASGESSAIVNGVGGALEGLASIDFKNPVSWVTGTMKALSSIFAIGDNVKEAKIQRLQQQITVLANDYKELAFQMENCYSDEINDLYEEENKNLQEQQDKVKQQMQLEKDKKKTDRSKVEGFQTQIEELERQIKKNEKAQTEMLAGTTIQKAIDDFATALVEAYAKGESGAEALGEKTKEVLKNAVKEALKRQFLGKGIEEAVNYLGEAMKDGILTADEKARFEAFVQAAGANFTQAMDAYKDLFQDTPEIESMRGEISKALTETTASKLEGIFRGTYDSVLNLRSAVRELLLVQRMGMGNVSELLRQNFQIALNTRRSADNSDSIRQDLRAIHTGIAQIANNTKIKNYAL